MPRRLPVLKTDGHNRIHWPGVYEHVLRRCASRTPMDVTSTLTSDEAVDQPAPAVRLATERRESDGRFARR
jgi:hypothetical protein